jgi:outer membrane protein assembly factor BamB
VRAAFVCLALALPLSAADRWTEFRGPAGTGHSDATGMPRAWSETAGVAWKTQVHGRGWSSPVVLGSQVWLTTATRDGRRLSVLAFDRESGKVLHDILLFEVEKPEDTARYNSFASPTPVIEDGRVYVHFGSYGTAAIDTGTGKPLWTRRDLPCNHWRGPGASPILDGDRLIVQFDGYDLQYAVALDKRSGRTLWRAERTHDYATDDGDLKKAYATPVVVEAAGRRELVSQAAKAVFGLDPATGRELWRVRYDSHSAATRVLSGHGLLYVGTGRGPSDLLAIRPGGRGDVTGSHVVWRAGRGIGASPSPLLVGDFIYTVADKGGVLTCLDARTGAEVYQKRTGAEAHSASLLYADGALYLFAEDGSALLVAPGPEYREVGRARLGEGGVMATPAIAGRALFVRTEAHLYRIEQAR